MLQALEAVNTQLRELYPDSEELFDIVLMTNNHAQVGVRLINSINHYGEHSTALARGQGVMAQQRVKKAFPATSKPCAGPVAPCITES